LLSIANIYPYKQLDRLVAAKPGCFEFRREHPLVLGAPTGKTTQAAVCGRWPGGWRFAGCPFPRLDRR
jgi:hypothetical protein